MAPTNPKCLLRLAANNEFYALRATYDHHLQLHDQLSPTLVAPTSVAHSHLLIFNMLPFPREHAGRPLGRSVSPDLCGKQILRAKG